MQKPATASSRTTNAVAADDTATSTTPAMLLIELERERIALEKQRLILEERRTRSGEKTVQLLEKLVSFAEDMRNSSSGKSTSTITPTARNIANIFEQFKKNN